jgi:acetolactate synthase-1/2/3 large subunit
LSCPERDVLAYLGDGEIQMTLQELATAAQYQLDLVLIVVNNNQYGTIRMHQEMHYPGRIKNTELPNPDFAALAHAYGAHGECVATTADFFDAFERAHATAGPALIELRLDSDAIAPGRALSNLG